MSVFPTAGSRTSVPLQNQRLLTQLHADQTTIQSYYDQLSTGQRIQRIGEDPAAASRAISLQSSIRYGEQLVRNADETTAFYASADQALSVIDDALIESRGAAVQAASNVLPDEERDAIAIGIRQSMEQIVNAGNTTFRDHQMLAGILQPGPSLVAEAGTVLFTGTQATGQTKASSNVTVQTTVALQSALGNGEPLVHGEPLDTTLTEATRLIDTRGGQGIRPGPLRISDGTTWQEVDLSTTATIGDVKDVLESIDLNGRSLSVTIQDDSLRIEYQDGLAGTLAISDPPGSRTAADLNIENKDGFDPPPLFSGKLTPQVTAGTTLDQLNAGAGIDVSAGIQIQQGNETFTIDLSDAETVGDVIIAINRSGADVRAVVDQTNGRIDIEALRAGVDYSIGENGGTAATALGIRSATAETTLDSLGHERGILNLTDAPELTIIRPDGTELELEFEGLETVQDVLDAINSHPDNQDVRRVTASLNSVGNGIELVAPPDANPLTVRQAEASSAGNRLGLIPEGENEAVGFTQSGTAVFVGSDYALREPGGAIDSLLRLEQAVRDGDTYEIGRLQEQVDDALKQAVTSRARVGIWTQNVEIMRNNASDQVVSLNEQLSNTIDTDFADVIANMNASQTALQATMQLIGQTSQLSLLNYL